MAYSAPPMSMIVRHGRERLDVVDQRRPLVQALDRRERRLQARVAALALERVEQARLLAADVGAGAAVEDQRRARGRVPRMSLADVAGAARFGDRRVEDVAPAASYSPRM